MGRRRKRWSFTAGSKPYSVTVEERDVGGLLRVRIWNPKARAGSGGWVRRSLGHKDRERAKAYARELNAQLEGEAHEIEVLADRLTWADVFTLYLEHRTPEKRTQQARRADHRRAEMWTRFLGAKSDPRRLLRRQFKQFCKERASGAIDPWGLREGQTRTDEEGKTHTWRPPKCRENADGERLRGPGPRQVGADAGWLKAVIRWAMRYEVDAERTLMRENPIETCPIPRESNPRRPWASVDRYLKLRSVTDEVTMGKGKNETRSYLTEIFDLSNSTGRRISAVLGLRYGDVSLERTPETPHGSLTFRASHDKRQTRHVIAMNPTARAAIDRVVAERPGIGEAPLLPAPQDHTQPMSADLADKWLRKAEKLAGVAPQKGTLWHAYRRGFAMRLKHLPVQDVARAGGWASAEVVQDIYQQAEAALTRAAMMDADPLQRAHQRAHSAVSADLAEVEEASKRA